MFTLKKYQLEEEAAGPEMGYGWKEEPGRYLEPGDRYQGSEWCVRAGLQDGLCLDETKRTLPWTY